MLDGFFSSSDSDGSYLPRIRFMIDFIVVVLSVSLTPQRHPRKRRPRSCYLIKSHMVDIF